MSDPDWLELKLVLPANWNVAVQVHCPYCGHGFFAVRLTALNEASAFISAHLEQCPVLALKKRRRS